MREGAHVGRAGDGSTGTNGHQCWKQGRKTRRRNLKLGLNTFHSAPWRSGYAAACKAVYTGSIPVGASRSTSRSVAPDVDGWSTAVDSYGEVVKLAEEGIPFALDGEAGLGTTCRLASQFLLLGRFCGDQRRGLRKSETLTGVRLWRPCAECRRLSARPFARRGQGRHPWVLPAARSPGRWRERA